MPDQDNLIDNSVVKPQGKVPLHGRLCLASASPRRHELLKQIGLDPLVFSVDIDESQLVSENVDNYVERLAKEKAQAADRLLDDTLRREGWSADLVLGADTAIGLDDHIMGKPASLDEAREMLRALSGRRHRVVTAVALIAPGSVPKGVVVATDVLFRSLSPMEIESYLASGEPMGKAGAYAIQGRGATLVERLEGSYSGVVGLPLSETWQMLASHIT